MSGKQPLYRLPKLPTDSEQTSAPISACPLVMMLRARCLNYALSTESDQIIPAINQLCAVYQEAPVRVGLKSFDVFRGFYEEYVRIQEQVFLAREQTRSAEQRPVQETNNLLNYAHDLLEGLIRRLAALGTFSLDVLSGRENADETRTPMTIPNHPFLKGSTLRTICRQAGINREEFLREAFVSAFPTGIR